MSSTKVAPHFVNWVGQASNLDRCTKCGRPRSVHGADWSCPAGVPRRMADAALITGSAAIVVGIALRLASAVANHQIPACLFLAGVVLFIAGLSLGEQQH